MDLRAPIISNPDDKRAEQPPLRPAGPRSAASARDRAPGMPGHDGDPGAPEYASWLRLLRPTAS